MVSTIEPIIVIREEDESKVEVIGNLFPQIIEAATVGPQGIPGIDGADGAQGIPGPQNLFVQATNPNMTSPGLWIQTFPNGDLSFWVEDGA